MYNDAQELTVDIIEPIYVPDILALLEVIDFGSTEPENYGDYLVTVDPEDGKVYIDTSEESYFLEIDYLQNLMRELRTLRDENEIRSRDSVSFIPE